MTDESIVEVRKTIADFKRHGITCHTCGISPREMFEKGIDRALNILTEEGKKAVMYDVPKFYLGVKERLKAEKPALVLTDIKMPSFSGIDLIKFIHQNMKGIPIIVMTADSHLYPENRNGNEVEGYFVKPFDINEMLSSIEKILGV